MNKTKIKSIRSTIFNRMVFAVCMAAGAAVLAMLVIVYILVNNGEKEQVITSTTHTAEYLNRLKTTEEKIDFMESMYNDIKEERKTIIAADGTVVYDSAVKDELNENYNDHPEVKLARADGSGEKVRRSQATGQWMYYYAVGLNDNSVLRTSKTLSDMYRTLIALFPASVLLMICIMLATRKASMSITTKIMRPIYETDINDPDENAIYPELVPFFMRIKAENVEKAKTEAIRREFTANVSHELKTPLTSISGYAQMINNGMARPEDISMFGLKIEKEADRLLLLIDDIIGLSHLDETQTIDAVPINLNEIVIEEISHFSHQLEERDISLYYSGDDCCIKGRATMLGELAANIIDNAIKYNHEGGRVDVYVGKSPDGVEFSVSDTGIGIPEEDLERIFERFYRVDKSHSKKIGGTGLGLSIVKHVVLIHNAQINVKSEIGKGTTVTVTFDGSAL